MHPTTVLLRGSFEKQDIICDIILMIEAIIFPVVSIKELFEDDEVEFSNIDVSRLTSLYSNVNRTDAYDHIEKKKEVSSKTGVQKVQDPIPHALYYKPAVSLYA
jgi:hypothetical protein